MASLKGMIDVNFSNGWDVFILFYFFAYLREYLVTF
jgi:hypothetical protein